MSVVVSDVPMKYDCTPSQFNEIGLSFQNVLIITGLSGWDGICNVVSFTVIIVAEVWWHA